MLFESTRPVSLALLQNKNLGVLSYAEVFWWARVDSNKSNSNEPSFSVDFLVDSCGFLRTFVDMPGQYTAI